MYIKFADDSILQVNSECQTFTKENIEGPEERQAEPLASLPGCPFSPCMHVQDPRRLQIRLHRQLCCRLSATLSALIGCA
jgi:hypothetical protein